jgi:putative restriction endonuclease
VTANGLCLCKLHHWAFDQQLIAITYEGGDYLVKVTERAENALGQFALALLRTHEGKIPVSRLPRRAQDRPHVSFLNKLYELLGQGN